MSSVILTVASAPAVSRLFPGRSHRSYAAVLFCFGFVCLQPGLRHALGRTTIPHQLKTESIKLSAQCGIIVLTIHLITLSDMIRKELNVNRHSTWPIIWHLVNELTPVLMLHIMHICGYTQMCGS
jgi:hypothetical protein